MDDVVRTLRHVDRIGRIDPNPILGPNYYRKLLIAHQVTHRLLQYSTSLSTALAVVCVFFFAA
jgi:hypothetical protein